MAGLPENLKRYIEADGSPQADGYIRFLSQTRAKEYEEIMETWPAWEGGIPFAVSAFGDVFVWTPEKYILLCRMAEGITSILMYDSEFFFRNINDPAFQSDFFDMELYRRAREKLGVLRDSQSFVFEPVPALGGSRELDTVSVGDTAPYLLMLCAL